jgi:hypothetical protein
MTKFGWDLPPGCNVSDIPGNRPEDEAWYVMIDNFFASLDEKEKQLAENCEEVIIKAIEYGIEAQIAEQKIIDEESKYYEQMAKEYQENKQ